MGIFLLLAGLLPAQEIAVWGWQAKAWNDLLRENFQLDAHTLTVPGHSAEIPREAWDGSFKVVILGRGAPASLSHGEREQVRHFLENGGFLIINNIAITGLATAENKADLSEAADWLGAESYRSKKIQAEILERNHPALRHLDRNDYAWLESERALSRLTSGRNLIGQGEESILMVHRFGKGGVLFLFPDIPELLADRDSPDVTALLKILETFLNASLTGSPSPDEVFGKGN